MKRKFNINTFMKSIGDLGMLLFAFGVFIDIFIEVTFGQIATLIGLGLALVFISCFRWRGGDSE